MGGRPAAARRGRPAGGDVARRRPPLGGGELRCAQEHGATGRVFREGDERLTTTAQRRDAPSFREIPRQKFIRCVVVSLWFNSPFMIYYDTTKMGAARQRSGLTRVSARLREEFGGTVTEVAWDAARRGFVTGKARTPVVFAATDWLLTVELFSEAERPGFWNFVNQPPCRLAAMFH